MAANLRTMRATITKVNDTGFQCAEEEDWFNLSKYAKPPLVQLGARVLGVVS